MWEPLPCQQSLTLTGELRVRRKSRYRHKEPRKPIDHPVSAIFDEPFDCYGTTVLRWWYGDRSEEQRGTGTNWTRWYVERVRFEDLKEMEQRVWGDPYEPPKPFDFAAIVPANVRRDVR